MSFEKIPYDKQRLETFRVRLENFAQAAQPIAYAVSIDGVEVIPRTTDANLFSSIYQLLSEKTKTVSVSEYIGNTRNRDTTCFTFPNSEISNAPVLNGIDPSQISVEIEERVRKGVEEANQKTINDRLSRENQTLKTQLATLLDKLDKQEVLIKSLNETNKELSDLQNDKSEFTSLIELSKDVFHHITGRKPQESPLAGTEKETETETEEANPNKKESGTIHIAVPESEYESFKYFSGMVQSFDPVQRGLVTQLVSLLVDHPDLVEETFQTTYNKTL